MRALGDGARVSADCGGKWREWHADDFLEREGGLGAGRPGIADRLGLKCCDALPIVLEVHAEVVGIVDQVGSDPAVICAQLNFSVIGAGHACFRLGLREARC